MLHRKGLPAGALRLLLAQLALLGVACAEVQASDPTAAAVPLAAALAGTPTASATRPPPATVPRLTAQPAPTFAEDIAPATVAPTTPTLQPTATPAPWYEQSVLGTSVAGRAMELHRLGTGPVNLVLVGGHHGGYEWNTTLLAYEVIDQLRAAPDTVPAQLTVYVIPNANPDGLFAITGREGRFTREDVDESGAARAFQCAGRGSEPQLGLPLGTHGHLARPAGQRRRIPFLGAGKRAAARLLPQEHARPGPVLAQRRRRRVRIRLPGSSIVPPTTWPPFMPWPPAIRSMSALTTTPSLAMLATGWRCRPSPLSRSSCAHTSSWIGRQTERACWRLWRG